MIGVIAKLSERAVVTEFFELFKTPWEFYRCGSTYDVLLCSDEQPIPNCAARLTVIYSSHESHAANRSQIIDVQQGNGCVLSYQESPLPIYGSCLTFGEGDGTLTDETSGRTAIRRDNDSSTSVIWVGYNLFAEVSFLLTSGQPVAFAQVPTLESHIAILRELIVTSGLSLVEIPPVPSGYRAIVCLTHNVDHPFLRRHSWDHTLLGFLYRALVGSAWNLLCRRIGLKDFLSNWSAALTSPLMYLGLKPDLWSGFEDRYLKMEKGIPSTYFVLPFANRPGRGLDDDHAPKFRAARYGVRDIAEPIRKLQAAGCEVGLHGIDAWANATKGREELEEIGQVSGRTEIGSRMHWLYFDENSPSVLERAGIDYDSSIGYRETVGFRAGTTQAYKPLQAETLLEIPLHAMDTALFYPGYLGLTSDDATKILQGLTDQVERFGGCLVINWHDRSLAPERLWHACYGQVLKDLKARGMWFATAAQVVAWFRIRRSAEFNLADAGQELSPSDEMGGCDGNELPGLRLRTHKPQFQPNSSTNPAYVDVPLNRSKIVRFAHAASN